MFANSHCCKKMSKFNTTTDYRNSHTNLSLILFRPRLVRVCEYRLTINSGLTSKFSLRLIQDYAYLPLIVVGVFGP